MNPQMDLGGARMAKSETPNESGGPRITRRSLIKGAAAGGGLLVMPSLLAACGDDAADTTTTAAAATESTEAAMALEGTTIKVGSNASDELTKNAYDAMFTRFEEISGATLDINTVDHNTYQENISTYLQNPDDVLAWFAGFRMRFFAETGLLGDITEKTYEQVIITVEPDPDPDPSPAPAPATLLLLGLGMAGIGFKRRMQIKRA